MALYEPVASLVPQPGQIVQGRDGIRQALLQFLALKGTMEMKSIFTRKLSGTGPDGKPIEMTGQSVEVVRQQPGGEWLLAIDHPFGAE